MLIGAVYDAVDLQHHVLAGFAMGIALEFYIAIIQRALIEAIRLFNVIEVFLAEDVV